MVDMLTCPNCGQKNRVQEGEDSSGAICAKCWTRLNAESRKPVPPPKPDGAYQAPQSTQKKKPRNIKNIAWGLVALSSIFIVPSLLVYSVLNSESSKVKTPNSIPIVKPTYTKMDMPKNGAIQMFTKRERVAPLTIKTSAGSNYFVKLVTANTNDAIMTIFIRGGNTVSTNVPLGSYEVRYATGKDWYGYEHLFGEDTGYSEAETIFKFENDGYQVSGYTISLYQVRDGNLRTKRINANSF